MSARERLYGNIDWMVVLIYGLLVLLGWLNIYAVEYDETQASSIFSLSQSSGKQLLWIALSFVLIIGILSVDFRFYETFSYLIYGVFIVALLAVLVFGQEVAGSSSWFQVGSFKIQPSEFSKFATALALARFMSPSTMKIEKIKNQVIMFLIFGIPAVLIILQGDTGTAMVFSAFMIVIYREGFSQELMILGVVAIIIFVLTLLFPKTALISGVVGLMVLLIVLNRKNTKRIPIFIAGAVIVIGVIISVDYVITDLLKPHQQNRIKALINPAADPTGYGWNVTQSKIAIGSGGFAGKGFLNGTQTKFDFVPEQRTDFIFCTIGEEHGWIGSLILIVLFITLLLRVVTIAERQKSRFARVYAYGVASILFFHFGVNIGMTIGLFPVIGIPLPFFSYGGSSLFAFTILLFILLKIDSNRMQIFSR